MKKSRSQIACPDSGSGFILGESDKSSIFLKTGLLFLRAGPAWDLSEAAVRRSWCFRPNCYLSFSANYCFSVISFSTPPGGYVRTKKSFTLSVQSQSFVGAGSGIRTHEGVTPNGCHVNRRISRWDLEAVALTTQPSRRNPRPRPGRVLNHFQRPGES